MSDGNQSDSILSRILMLLTGVFIGLIFTMPNDCSRKQGNNTPLDESFKDVINLIETKYVENIDDDTLTNRAINAILKELDPHSRYISPTDYEKEEAAIIGQFEGIGVVIYEHRDTFGVREIIAGGPAEKTDLQPGDIFLAVDNDTILGRKHEVEEVISKIRGPHATTVTLSVLRQGVAKPIKIAIKRHTINSPTVFNGGIIQDKTGYLRVVSFGQHTAQEFHNALIHLKQQGMENLVVDLRGNGGGILDCAISMANEFLEKGDMIVYIEGKSQPRRKSFAKGNGCFKQGKVLVLIDEYSASASEVFSGALQDNDRATIAGRRSFGKGLVQQGFTLSNGGTVLLTIARYYTPSGRCIQRPYDKGSDEYYMEVIKRQVENLSSDTIPVTPADTTPYHTKNGHIVYGGGGITPDKSFAYEHDTNVYYFNRLYNNGVFIQYAFNYVRAHYSQLHKQFPSEQSFANGFAVSDNMTQEIIALGKKEGIASNPTSVAQCTQRMRNIVKAHIAEMLFGTDAFFRYYTYEDNDVKKALTLINQ